METRGDSSKASWVPATPGKPHQDPISDYQQNQIFLPSNSTLGQMCNETQLCQSNNVAPILNDGTGIPESPSHNSLTSSQEATGTSSVGSTPATQFEDKEPKQGHEKSCQSKEDRQLVNNTDGVVRQRENSSDAVSKEVPGKSNSGQGGDVSLGRSTPAQQKPRRKRYMPKVVREGQTKSTPNVKTQKPVNPSDVCTLKRKYVRRKETSIAPNINFVDLTETDEDSPNISKNIHQDTPSVNSVSSKPKKVGRPRKSCKRSLKFDTSSQVGEIGSSCSRASEIHLESGAQGSHTEIQSTMQLMHEPEATVGKGQVEQTADVQSGSTRGNNKETRRKRPRGSSTRVKNIASVVENEISEELRSTRSNIMQDVGNSHQPYIHVEKTTKKQTKRNTRDLGSYSGAMLSIDALVDKLRHLDINAERKQSENLKTSKCNYYSAGYQEQNALAVYQRDDTLVTMKKQMKRHRVKLDKERTEQSALVVYQRDGTLVTMKEQMKRPRVKLDEETTRVWNLLLEDINSEGIDGTDEKTKKWWEDERRIFNTRANSFIKCMHLIQGDRTFSRWKGSVVDSVVGVFLTPNVSDHLSSSAYMSLAAQFPLLLESNHDPLIKEVMKIPVNDLDVNDLEAYILNPADTLESLEMKSEQGTLNQRSVMIQETESNEGIDILKTNEPYVNSINCAIPQNISSWNHMDTDRKISFVELLQMVETSNYNGEAAVSPGIQREGTEDFCKEESGSSRETASCSVDMTCKPNKGKKCKGKQTGIEWDSLRKQAEANGKRVRTPNTMDSVDWEAVRLAGISEIAHIIRDRGMNNVIAERIKDFLDQLVRDHGSIDLEWLRDVPPDTAKKFLMSIRGLGLKSVECVRLLTLHHIAFPVDTNVGRIAVRLGWVPLQPLPESLQLHLLEMYPVLESVQQYLWPRLCKLDQRTLYELHYQMITFGKVFCTKSKPNCNACPLRSECRHFASAFASARLALPGKEGNTMTSEHSAVDQYPVGNIDRLPVSPSDRLLEANMQISHCEPIIELPASPGPVIELPATPEAQREPVLEEDIEDFFIEDPEDIPTIKLNIEEFTQTLQDYIQWNMNLQEGDVSKSLVALTPEAASIPAAKLKNVGRLRTEHQVYELPDAHPLLTGLEQRESDDPCSYLLAIWTPGETVDSIHPPTGPCSNQESGSFCSDNICFACCASREAQSQIVRGTLLIPCRTAMRGRFPLNGTYFQINEVFADHASSLHPIEVPRNLLWNLPRKTVYFGTSIPAIFRGMTTEDIQRCFWKGFVCVRGFDRESRAPRPLLARLHFPPSKVSKKNEKKEKNVDGAP
ncbi:DNA glycosylase/AP lyase ROS1-like [Apium graveolens]|uniref:DNA glycosylase/AP lyase ROS1-like n=1 Tax=Apium graveolens TaxID=4045 RepID=UPI003D7AE909